MSKVNASNPAYMFKAYYRQLSMPTPAEVTPTPTVYPCNPTLQPDPAPRIPPTANPAARPSSCPGEACGARCAVDHHHPGPG